MYDAALAKFYFLEVNTRLQVEHGVTEEVGGIDLVEWMIRTAAGEPPDLRAHQHEPQGHAIQARVYAEDPARNFRPVERPAHAGQTTCGSIGSLRVDGWIEAGTEVTAYYDPMLAKVIARGATRELAIANLAAALNERTHRRHRDQPALPGFGAEASGIRRGRTDHSPAVEP